MTTSTIHIVQPNHRKWETVLLVAALIALVLSTGTYVETYGLEEKPQEILDWQISSFSGLQGIDQAIYNELIVAADEVNWLVYYNGYWPDDADFQENLLAPFYRDLSWEHNGSVKWTLKNVIQEGEAQGLTLYHGGGGTIETQGAFLLVIDHKHAGNAQITASNIWWHADRNAPIPETSKVASLILHGWKQVIPYQGKDEMERLNAE
ncbi:MAG: hypothetical protein V4628_15330 [Pseudomonadota bacterium]